MPRRSDLEQIEDDTTAAVRKELAEELFQSAKRWQSRGMPMAALMLLTLAMAYDLEEEGRTHTLLWDETLRLQALGHDRLQEKRRNAQRPPVPNG